METPEEENSAIVEGVFFNLAWVFSFFDELDQAFDVGGLRVDFLDFLQEPVTANLGADALGE